MDGLFRFKCNKGDNFQYLEESFVYDPVNWKGQTPQTLFCCERNPLCWTPERILITKENTGKVSKKFFQVIVLWVVSLIYRHIELKVDIWFLVVISYENIKHIFSVGWPLVLNTSSEHWLTGESTNRSIVLNSPHTDQLDASFCIPLNVSISPSYHKNLHCKNNHLTETFSKAGQRTQCKVIFIFVNHWSSHHWW